MAAYHDFPHGAWLRWDSRISMDGSFIQGWMDRSEGIANSDDESREDNFQTELWQEFQQIVSLFYRYPLIVEDG